MKLSSNGTVYQLIFAVTVVAVGVSFALTKLLDGKYLSAAMLFVFSFNLYIGIMLGIELQKSIYKDAAALRFSESAVTPIPAPPIVLENSHYQGWDGFDPDEPEYPKELDIALQAWRAVRNSNNGGPIKPQLELWVRTNYKDIKSISEIERIVTVANWSAGGRPAKRLGNSATA